MPMNPIRIERLIRITVYTNPLAERTRDWVIFREPSLLAVITKASACPLRCFLRNPRPSDATMRSAARPFSNPARITQSCAASTSDAIDGSSHNQSVFREAAGHQDAAQTLPTAADDSAASA